MISLTYYASDYQTARRRFRTAATEANALQERHNLILEQCPGTDLSIDVALLGSENPDWTLVASSGLHGVEGFFGSAVQLALLSQFASGRILPGRGRIVLLHALNPFGFHFLRRGNEDNVDLNRNFLLSGQAYRGRPQGYDRLNDFLNPQRPPTLFDVYWIKGILLLLRLGLPALKAGIVAGQYDYPKGVFFGGQQACYSTSIVRNNMGRWLGGAKHCLHIDFHTGLGKFGTYKLLLPADVTDLHWYQNWFGAEWVEVTVDENGTAYRSTGTMGNWLMKNLKDAGFRYFNAEFGTFSEIRTLGALRNENCLHFYGRPGSTALLRAKSKLKESFCPASKRWRKLALGQGLGLIDRSIEALTS